MIQGKSVVFTAVEEEHLSQLMEIRNDSKNRRWYREYREIGIEHQKNWWKDKILNDDSWQYWVVKRKPHVSLARKSKDTLRQEAIQRLLNLDYFESKYKIDSVAPIIGVTGLIYIDQVNKTAEHALELLEEYRNNYTHDTILTALNYGFDELNLNRIWIEIYEGKWLREYYDTLGFVYEGTKRQTVFKNGEYHDSHILSMLRKDWYDKRK